MLFIFFFIYLVKNGVYNFISLQAYFSIFLLSNYFISFFKII